MLAVAGSRFARRPLVAMVSLVLADDEPELRLRLRLAVLLEPVVSVEVLSVVPVMLDLPVPEDVVPVALRSRLVLEVPLP